MVIIKSGKHELEILPERGAIISYWKFNGIDIFYQDAQIKDEAIIRGGMPILFPICGQLENDIFWYERKPYKIHRHGFARDCKWDVVQTFENGIKLKLQSNVKTFRNYPFHFEFNLIYQVIANALVVECFITNNNSYEMPYQIGFHPYIFVEDKCTSNLQMDWSKEVSHISDLSFSYSFNHKLFAIELREIENFNKVVVWSLPSHPFVCIEPWLGDVDSIHSDTSTKLLPFQTNRHKFSIVLDDRTRTECLKTY